MKLPTPEEYAAALERYEKEGPQPVAASMDASQEMTAIYLALKMSLPLMISDQAIKAFVVLGLNVGIHIGEARAVHCPEPWMHRYQDYTKPFCSNTSVPDPRKRETGNDNTGI